MNTIKKFLEKNFILIVFVFLILLFFKGCADSKKIDKLLDKSEIKINQINKTLDSLNNIIYVLQDILEQSKKIDNNTNVINEIAGKPQNIYITAKTEGEK
jgi:hypothetical protein